MFIELNIPFQVVNKNLQLSSQVVASLTKLGYSGVVLNTIIENRRVKQEDAPQEISIASKSSDVQSETMKSNSESSNEFHIYRRLTISTNTVEAASSISSGSASKQYDLLAIRTENQAVFEYACKEAKIDIIEINFSKKVPFKLNKKIIDVAINRGIMFELPISQSLRDRTARKLFFSFSYQLIFVTRGNHIIFSNGDAIPLEQKSPRDYIILAQLLGIPYEKAKRCLVDNVIQLFENANKRSIVSDSFIIEENKGNDTIESEEASKEQIEESMDDDFLAL
ncbi:hypothetical protein WA158_005002 [Blastocystis sp. Blastoise]